MLLRETKEMTSTAARISDEPVVNMIPTSSHMESREVEVLHYWRRHLKHVASDKDILFIRTNLTNMKFYSNITELTPENCLTLKSYLKKIINHRPHQAAKDKYSNTENTTLETIQEKL